MGNIKKVFLTQHTHTDIGYTDFQERIIESHAFYTAKVVDFCEKTRNYPSGAQFKWICETFWQTANFLKQCTNDQKKRFLKLVKEGRIEVTSLYYNFVNIYSAEEIIRSLYSVHELRTSHKLDIKTAMNCDVNGISWGLVPILAQAGIKYLCMCINETRGKAALNRPCAFYWKGRDGSKLLVWNGEHYMYGYLGLKITDGVKTFKENLSKYIEKLEKNNYSYDFIVLPCSMGDNAPPTLEIANVVKEWNDQGLTPKLQITTLSEIFDYLEKKFGESIPVLTGDWVNWWDDGCGSSPFESGLAREAHSTIRSAEIIYSFANGEFKYPHEKIKETWDDLLLFDEHTWGAWNSVCSPYSFNSQAQWAWKALSAYRAFSSSKALVEKGLSSVLERVNKKDPIILVFNTLPWKRDDVVTVRLPFEKGRTFRVIDAVTKKEVIYERKDMTPVCWTWPQVEITFIAEDVPSVGYKMYRVINGKPKPNKNFKTKRFKISIDPKTGAISSLYDKNINSELVDEKSEWRLNQFIYEVIDSKDGREALYGTPDINSWRQPWGVEKKDTRFKRESLKKAQIQTLSSQLGKKIISTGKLGEISVEQQIMLYNDLERIDFVNTIQKPEIVEPEAIYFAFPFAVKNPTVRIEIAGTTMEPGKEQLVRTSHDWYTAQDWVDVSNSSYGITLASKEALLFQFGDINTGKWLEKNKITNGSIFSWAMNNYWFTNYKWGHGGVCTFRYSILPYKGTFSVTNADRFGSGISSPLCAIYIENGSYLAGEKSFCEIDQENIKLLAIKKADSGNGLVLRLQEIAGKKTTCRISMNRLTSASACTLFETPIQKLSSKKPISADFKPFEIKTLLVK